MLGCPIKMQVWTKVRTRYTQSHALQLSKLKLARCSLTIWDQPVDLHGPHISKHVISINQCYICSNEIYREFMSYAVYASIQATSELLMTTQVFVTHLVHVWAVSMGRFSGRC
jgi:hypothetical protein